MKTARPLIFTIFFFCVVLILVIYRYEKLLKEVRKENLVENVAGGYPSAKKYTAGGIITLIKGCKEYLGDSITIFDNGQMSTSNGQFQGTINAVLSNKDNMDVVMANMETNRLPVQYNIYVLAATYYRQQYPGKR
jgi:hypothetical protein